MRSVPCTTANKYSFLLRALASPRYRPKIVFCESFCRVSTLSLTGKIMYHVLADRRPLRGQHLLNKKKRHHGLARINVNFKKATDNP